MHLLLLHRAFAHERVHRRFSEGGGDAKSRSVAFAVVDYRAAVGIDIGQELRAEAQTPSLLQRVKRTNTGFQLPYLAGMSRQGDRVRKTHRMPLTVRRLSEIGGPRSPRLRSRGSNMRHSASVRTPRHKAALHQKGSLESFIYEETVNTA